MSLGAGVAAVVALVISSAGCSLVNYSGGDAGASGRGPAVRTVAREIPASTLAANGLETLWTQAAAAGTFRKAFLVGDDIFVVEERTSGEGPKARRSYTLVAFGRDDGLRRWVWDLKAPVTHPPFVYHYPASPERHDDEVFVVQRDEVYCLDYQYGTTLWKASLPFSISSGAFASETHYFVGSFDGRFFSIPKKSSVEDWKWFTENGEVVTNGTTRGDFVYFTATNGSAYRYHILRGRADPRSWQFKTGADVRGAPETFSRFVYVGSDDYKLYCLRDIDGSKAWDFQAQAPIRDTPVAVNLLPNLAVVFAISDDRRPAIDMRTLWAVNAGTGEELWSFDHVASVVGIGKRSVYILTDPRSGRGKTLVALDGVTGKEKFALPVDDVDIIPSTAGGQAPVKRQRGIIYLIHRSGLIQAIAEQL